MMTILPGGFDDGSCLPEAYYDCFGECLNDDNDEYVMS